jgi:UDP-glucose 4-epimerase
MDLASAHTSALENISGDPHFLTLNLGTGRGYSVLEVLNAFESTTGRPIPYEIVPRRPMDLAQCLADPTLAYKTLGWQAKFDIHKMCADSWHWQSMNPNGYLNQ